MHYIIIHKVNFTFKLKIIHISFSKNQELQNSRFMIVLIINLLTVTLFQNFLPFISRTKSVGCICFFLAKNNIDLIKTC